MKIIGYKFSSIKSGIKKDKFDLGLIYCLEPSLCVSAFTKNLLKSNSIIVSQKNLSKTKYIRAIITNSGCANTACGKNGIKITKYICKSIAKKLNIKQEEVLIASTGVIGEPLPKNKIVSNFNSLINSLSSNKKSIINFAKSIMTTDTKPKIVYKTIKIKNKKGNFLCFAKGAGMIAPNLEISKPHATMLVFLLTDIKLKRTQMCQIMKNIIIPNFNSFSIDGDTSPNDTIFFVSNGTTNIKISENDFKKIKMIIYEICNEIILKLLFDGEGVTKVVKLIIKNSTKKNAELIFKTISNSLLVKTAITGADPNWGRILSACGRSGAKIDISKINIFIGKHQVVKNGTSNFVPDSILRNTMLKNFYDITIDLCQKQNNKQYIFYITDLSKKYVDINSKYKT